MMENAGARDYGSWEARHSTRMYMRHKMICITVVVVFGVTELGIRTSGLTDVPAYTADSEIGYIVKPNQSGRFLNKN
jgi:hypothetical protein